MLYGRYLQRVEQTQLPELGGCRIKNSADLLADVGGSLGVSLRSEHLHWEFRCSIRSNKGDRQGTQEQLNVTVSAGGRLFDQLFVGVALTDLGDRFDQGLDVGIRWEPLDPSLVKQFGIPICSVAISFAWQP